MLRDTTGSPLQSNHLWSGPMQFHCRVKRIMQLDEVRAEQDEAVLLPSRHLGFQRDQPCCEASG